MAQRFGPVLAPVTTLLHVKSPVGTDVRHLEIFDYGEGGAGGLVAFGEFDWDAFEEPELGITVTLFNRNFPATIQPGDTIEYELDQSDTWFDSGITWAGGNQDFLIFGPFLGPTVQVRIRYVQGGNPSPPSNVIDVFISGGGPEG